MIPLYIFLFWSHGMMILMLICDDMSVRSRMIRRRRVVKKKRENWMKTRRKLIAGKMKYSWEYSVHQWDTLFFDDLCFSYFSSLYWVLFIQNCLIYYWCITMNLCYKIFLFSIIILITIIENVVYSELFFL